MTDTPQKLRIAVVCDSIIDYVNGANRSALRFSQKLKERGHTVVFLAARSPMSPTDGVYEGIKVYRFRSFCMPKAEGKYYIALPRKKELAHILQDERIDIVHLMIPTPLSIRSAQVARSLGIKVVSHSHAQPENLFLHLPVPSFLCEPLNRLFDAYMSWIYKKTDFIVYPSEFAHDLLHHLAGETPQVVISNGVDTTKFAKREEVNYFSSFGVPEHARCILYVGRLHPEKSIETMIESAPLVLRDAPNTYFFIAGDGHLYAKLQKLITDRGVADHVRLLGQINDEDLIRAYNDCDVFVLPSLAELEGMVVLEAMACGKPIVIANAPASASRYFVQENGFLFEPGNAADLAAQLQKLITDDALRMHMGEKSLALSKNYDIQHSIDTLESIYNQTLAR